MTAAQFAARFPDEEACCAYLAAARWPRGVRCPRCGARARQAATKPWHWQCYQCSPGHAGYRFSVRVGTIFENSKFLLLDWFRAIHLMTTSPRDVSALAVQRAIGAGSYRAVLHMCRRIRAGMCNTEPFLPVNRAALRKARADRPTTHPPNVDGDRP